MNRGEVWTCGKGMQITVLEGADCSAISCCDQPMKLEKEKTADSKTEKHVPVITEIEGGYKVTVGSVLHPMVDDHYIQWIELTAGKKVYRQHLEPGEAPEAVFLLETDGPIVAREFCNKHGLWKV